MPPKVLADFGIAETDDSGHPARENGDNVGSPTYIAPELVRGETPRPATDLWSLGATLYAAVEGHPPFEGGDSGSTLVSVLLAAPAPTRFADRLAPLLYTLLVKEPTRRPGHDAMHAALTDAYPRKGTLVANGRAAAEQRHRGSATAAAPLVVEGLTNAASR